MFLIWALIILAAWIAFVYFYYWKVTHAEWIKLDNRFHEIQKAFADNDSAVRAVAALQLGEMAIMYCPRKVSSVVTEDYPFLQRAASQFAVALNVETHAKVRTALVEAIMTLLNFAEYRVSGLPKDYLIDTLINANRTALENFVKSLASYLASQPNEDKSAMMEKCALVSAFCEGNIEANREVIKVLCTMERFKAEMAVQREIHASMPINDEQKKNTITLLASVQDAANRLINTKDALVRALKTLRERIRSRFDHQFLAGADLQTMELALSHFEEAFLIGANLYGASMGMANFDGAFMSFANLSNAHLRQTSLFNANLQGANFSNATLAFAELTSAKVAMSNLNDAETVSASWKTADFALQGERDNDLYESMLTKFGDVPESLDEEFTTRHILNRGCHSGYSCSYHSSGVRHERQPHSLLYHT